MASFILVTFWMAAAAAIFVAAVMFHFRSRLGLPQEFEDLLLYGKLRAKERKWSIIQSMEVPKRYFVHFYVIGSLVNLFMFVVIAYCYATCYSFPALLNWVVNLLNIGNTKQPVSIDSSSAVLLIGLMLIHNIRRLLECVFVSVYSPNGTINVAHYLIGIALYTSFSFVVIVESPDPVTSTGLRGWLNGPLQWRQLCAISIFAWSSWQQSNAHLLLANLRKSKKGHIVNYDHNIPHGGWFKFVSCPHYFAEILLYLSFLVIGGYHHVTLLSVIVFVITNQLVSGYLTHEWYISQFGSSYPSKRRAVVPFFL